MAGGLAGDIRGPGWDSDANAGAGQPPDAGVVAARDHPRRAGGDSEA
jgi:hypothetical protein